MTDLILGAGGFHRALSPSTITCVGGSAVLFGMILHGNDVGEFHEYVSQQYESLHERQVYFSFFVQW